MLVLLRSCVLLHSCNLTADGAENKQSVVLPPVQATGSRIGCRLRVQCCIPWRLLLVQFRPNQVQCCIPQSRGYASMRTQVHCSCDCIVASCSNMNRIL
jgi:hypothetical protein